MAQAYLATRLSPNLSGTPENYLLCTGTRLARTATIEAQLYHASELGGTGPSQIKV